MAKRNPEVSVDEHIVAALRSRELTADSATGHCFLNGQPAGGAIGTGYIMFRVSGVTAMAHRVVWLAAHGFIPPGWEINHRNSRRWDNRLLNLEAVPRLENSRHRWGNEHAAVGDGEDDNVVSPEWLANVLALKASGQADRASIDALKTQVAQPSFLLKVDKHAS